MAKVHSPLKLSGAIGDLIFYKNEYGDQVRSKGQPSEWHLEHAETYENARRNAREFARSTGGGQLLHFAIGELYTSVKNIRLSGRMIGAMASVIKSDPVHGKGDRVISSGDLSLLQGFEFNHKLELDDALPLNIENCYTVGHDRISLQVPAFRIRKKKSIPAKATHYRVVSALITIDFDKKTYHRNMQKSPAYAIGRQAGAAFTAEHVLAPGTTGQFWMVGVEFFVSDKAGQAPLQGGALKVVRYVEAVLKEQIPAKQEVEVTPVDVAEPGLSIEGENLGKKEPQYPL